MSLQPHKRSRSSEPHDALLICNAPLRLNDPGDERRRDMEEAFFIFAETLTELCKGADISTARQRHLIRALTQLKQLTFMTLHVARFDKPEGPENSLKPL
jgi:hypothetical protein